MSLGPAEVAKIAHLARLAIRVEDAPAYARNTRKYISAPANAYRNHPKLEENLKPEELKKKKKVGELDDTELDGISGGEGMDTGKIIP